MRNLPAMLIFISALTPMAAGAAQPSPLASLSDAEQSYYTKVFDYTMAAVKPGEQYDWSSYSGAGSIKVSKLKKSKSGSDCRAFSESYNVLGASGTHQGVACKRGGEEGWCKLKLGNAQTCALEQPADMFAMPDININSIPAINMPGVALPSLPKIPHYSGNGGNNNAGVNNRPDVQRKTNTAEGNFADSVTRNAGDAAGSAAGGAIKWFQGAFR